MSVCVCSAPDDFRINPGAVEAVLQHPAQPEKVSSLRRRCLVNVISVILYCTHTIFFAFSASTLLVGLQEEHPACKN